MEWLPVSPIDIFRVLKIGLYDQKMGTGGTDFHCPDSAKRAVGGLRRKGGVMRIILIVMSFGICWAASSFSAERVFSLEKDRQSVSLDGHQVEVQSHFGLAEDKGTYGHRIFTVDRFTSSRPQVKYEACLKKQKDVLFSVLREYSPAIKVMKIRQAHVSIRLNGNLTPAQEKEAQSAAFTPEVQVASVKSIAKFAKESPNAVFKIDASSGGMAILVEPSMTETGGCQIASARKIVEVLDRSVQYSDFEAQRKDLLVLMAKLNAQAKHSLFEYVGKRKQVKTPEIKHIDNGNSAGVANPGQR